MDIIKQNQLFIDKINNDKKLENRRNELVKGQHPKLLVITCSDSRVVPEFIFNATLGEIFVIRTAGNVINEGELATVEYAIEHLKVEHIVVLGHTHCGAIHATIMGEQGKYMDPILNRIKHNIGTIQDELVATLINAEKEANFIREKFPEYQGKVEAKIYNIEDSKIY